MGNDIFGKDAQHPAAPLAVPLIEGAKCVKLQVGATVIDLATAGLLLQNVAIQCQRPTPGTNASGTLQLTGIVAKRSLLARLIDLGTKAWSINGNAAIADLKLALDIDVTYECYNCEITSYTVTANATSGLLVEQLAITFSNLIVTFPQSA